MTPSVATERELAAQRAGEGVEALPAGRPDDASAEQAALAATVAAVAASADDEDDQGVASAAVLAAAAGILGAFDRFLRRRRDAEEELIVDVIEEEMPNASVVERAELAAREAGYEAAFRRKMRERLDRDLPRALSITDPVDREAAVQRILDRERRYLGMREEAVAERARAAANNFAVEQASPEGAFWELDWTLDTHTADCLAAQGKVWPWQVLHAFNFLPKRHGRCGCRLRTVEWARRRGVYDEREHLSVEQAMRLMPNILALEEAVREADAVDVALEIVEAELLLPRWTTYRVLWADEGLPGHRRLVLDDDPDAAR